MIQHTITVFKKYAVFSGRASRAEYWYFVLAMLIVGFSVGLVGALAGFTEAELELFSNLLSLAILLPSIAVGVRRMHDINKSGWFIIIPIYNIYLAVQKGDVGPNQYGEDPYGGVREASPIPAPPAA